MMFRPFSLARGSRLTGNRGRRFVSDTRALVAGLVLLATVPAGVRAQSTVNVSTAGELAAAITSANAWSGGGPFTINLDENITLQPTAQMVISLSPSNTQGLIINGSGASIDMGAAHGGAGDRAFFVAGGQVTINDLTISSGRAAGGNGSYGAGGGAGLGGGIFVANSAAIPGLPTYDTPTNVVLSNVWFLNNTARGGNGGQGNDGSIRLDEVANGGGGGMGGNGAASYAKNDFLGTETAGGGGGGFGQGANGGAGSPGGDDASAGALVVSSASGGEGGHGGGNGGQFGGGGGGGDAGVVLDGAGGGGGAGGTDADGDSAGNGGFGGGGGGGGYINSTGGNGGFGGGGGAGQNPGSGGFGGGGAGSADGSDPSAAAGGFGGGAGAASSNEVGDFSHYAAAGGGGAGLGGAIFVMGGAQITIQGGGFTDNATTGGQGGSLENQSPFADVTAPNGSAYGDDLFVGGNVTFLVSSGSSLTVNNLGGAGNSADPNVAGKTGSPNANGNLTVDGGGMLIVSGSQNSFSGTTTIRSGTLQLAASSREQGTSQVIVGQDSGDNAVLALGSSSQLDLGGFDGPSGTDAPLIIAQEAGSIGSVVIGSGTGSSGSFIGARTFTGGDGTASVVFTQEFAAGSGSVEVYDFLTTLTGSLRVVQSGPGTTSLQPLYGDNTFTGGVLIEDGALIFAVDGAAGTGGIELAGGTGVVSSATELINAVIFTSSDATWVREVDQDNTLDLGTTGVLQSGLGTVNTAASLLAGTASADRELTISFGNQNPGADNDGERLSDVFNLSGTVTDIFVLQLAIDPLALSQNAYLAWLNNGEWVNAVLGNSAVGTSAVQGFDGSFAASGADATAVYLGSWGVDLSTGAAWAVLDHNSSFAIVPEPGTGVLLLAALGFALAGRRGPGRKTRREP